MRQVQERSIPQLLDAVRGATPASGRVLSTYVDTSGASVVGLGYLLRFQNGCKSIRESLPSSELARFEAAVAQAEQYLTESLVVGRKGLALFASGGDDYFFTASLPERPREDVVWHERPHLEPLVALLDEYERVAVALFDKERARLFSVYLGSIESCEQLTDDVPGKQATGGWFGLAQSRYARHHEDHVARHARHSIAALMEMLRRQPFDRLLVGGPDEAVEVLIRELPRPLRTRLSGRLHLELIASEGEVLTRALEIAHEIERAAEVEAVRDLLDAPSSRAAIGGAASLNALSEGRVHVLFLAEGFEAKGGQCPSCDRLVGDRPACPVCGAVVTPLEDLREAIVERAVDQGSRIEGVGGEAAAILLERGGIGAWTRH
jgi:peptide subunit release factor 1 (eRF1)